MELKGVAEKELVAVHIRHVRWAFPEYDVVEEMLLDKAEYGTVR